MPESGTISCMSRRSTDVLERSLRERATIALSATVDGVRSVRGSAGDLEIELDGHRVTIDVRTMAYATVERIEGLKQSNPPPGDRPVLVIADRINQPARTAIRAAGWGYFDVATGSLFLRAPGIRIDTSVDMVDPGTRSKPVGIVGRAGPILAYEILRRAFDTDPRPILTSRSKDEFDLPRSSTSDAFRALAAAGLLADGGKPVLPELFWELAKFWAPAERRWLARAPQPSDWATTTSRTRPAWRLGGTEAALAWGAPVVSAGHGPFELYVPESVLLSVAVRRYGSSDPIAAAASVALPTAHQVIDAEGSASDRHHRGWPLVHPIAAALDLAALGDARSQQILADWQPDGEAVWHER